MQHIELGFGKQGVALDIDEKNLQTVLMPNEVTVTLRGTDEVKRGLDEPIGKPKLSSYDLRDKKIVIITSDITRPVPSYKIIPSILTELTAAGASDKNITVVFALGSHRSHTEEEKRHLVGDDVYDRVSCVDANAEIGRAHV